MHLKTKALLLFFILTILTLLSFLVERGPSNDWNSVDLNSVSSKEMASFEAVVEAAKEQKITSVEDFLAALPEKYKSKFVLVYKSKSLQEASFQSPRLIAFTDDVIYSFNGSPTQEGFSQIEVMYLNRKNASFDMQEIRFTSERNKLVEVENNPESCKGCHGITSRPLWDNYPFWPGVYGSENDFRRRNVGTANDFRLEFNREELEKIIEFVELGKFEAIMEKHPRYAYFYQAYLKTFKPSDVRLGNRPNLNLNQLLYQHNLLTVQRDIVEKFPKAHLVDLQVILNSVRYIQEDLETRFIDHKDRIERIYRENYLGVLSKVEARWESHRKLARYYCENLKYRHFKEVKEFYGMVRTEGKFEPCERFVLEFADSHLYFAFLEEYAQRQGVDIRSWFLNFYPRAYINHTGGNINEFPMDLQRILLDLFLTP